ncbi:SMI1/KNR4 family protein [Mesorhizobium sp. Mes31]|uniref:SMI1/KNR4 family protein n=1 Tax=Mesorhizobium sp. Mes31 TaxID=2926017 RepID=UPI002118CDBE|nr:SMI1/KNR4 family protein [Mesorhizobium sp. Mes31]
MESVAETPGRIAVGYGLTEGQFDAPAEAAVVDGLSARLGVALPKDYTKFLKEHNGGEGFIGDSYIIFFKAEELVDFNREYEVEKYAPGILLFASNGGGEAYGFDTHDVEMPIVRIPFIFMERQSAETIARDLADLFATLGDLK